MITESQQEAMKVLLLPLLGSNPTTVTVAPYVGEEAARGLRVSSSIMQVAEWVVDRTLGEDTPQRLISLIRQIDDQSQRAASLVDLADRLEAAPSLWHRAAAPVDWSVENDPLLVHDGRPFIDRSSFRSLLPRLGQEDATPACTVVKGDDGHGKSYLTEFCKGLAGLWHKKRPNLLRVALTECPSSTLVELSPELPAIDLAGGLGTDFNMMPRPHEDEHRYARNLASWILEFSPEGALPALIIFDGFDRSGVPKPVYTLIEELIAGIQENDDCFRRLRVMLLGYDVGRLEKKGLAFEDCVLEFVDETHIDKWFRRRYPGQPGYRYDDAVDLIAGRLPQQGSMRMRTLCALTQAAGGAFRSSGGGQ